MSTVYTIGYQGKPLARRSLDKGGTVLRPTAKAERAQRDPALLDLLAER